MSELCAEILKLCVALLDDVHLSLDCDDLGVPNNPNLWTENSHLCNYNCPSMWIKMCVFSY